MLNVGDTEENESQLSHLITTVFNTLNTYGKDTGQLEDIIKLFLEILGCYEYSMVKRAFYFWVQKKNRMPTPADIINNIEYIIEQDGNRIKAEKKLFILQTDKQAYAIAKGCVNKYKLDGINYTTYPSIEMHMGRVRIYEAYNGLDDSLYDAKRD